MLEDEPSRIAVAKRAVAITQEHRGATDRTWTKIVEFLR
jgi:hypothetical protein